MSKTFNYGVWREDKEAEPGFSRELLSSDFQYIKDMTTLDDLNVLSYPGIDTLYKAMNRHVRRTPNAGWLGTRVG